jgi:NDP-sugar pyrophosphorylase family protein
VLCVGYRGEEIRDYAGDGSRFGMRLEYSFDGPRLLGTAGAIRQALPLLGGAFFVLYGDSYLTCDYRAVGQAFLASGKQGLMTVFRNGDRWDRSNVEMSAGSILAYDKAHPRPTMEYIDYGLGVLSAAAAGLIPNDRPHDLAAVYQDLLQRGELAAYEARERFYEVGSFEGIRELEEYLRTATAAPAR